MTRTVFVATTIAALVMALEGSGTTVIRGRVVTAIARQPVAAAIVKAGNDSVFTDAEGRYELRVDRSTTWFGIRKDGWLDFQYPLMDLSTDTLFANVELRSDPPSAESYLGAPVLPYLCVRMDDPAHLDVANSCQWPTYPQHEYSRRIIKHNPWNPYFGRAGDRGGVMLALRAR